MSDNQHIIAADELSKHSKVNDTVNKRVISKTTRYTVFLVIVLMIGFAYLTSKAHSRHKDNVQATSNTANIYTLQENLTALERMQQEAAIAAKKEHTPNYTSTPDGLKIGNPKAIRNAPPPRQEIDSELATRMNAPTTFINVDEPAVNQGHKNPELAAAPIIAAHGSNGEFLNAKNSIDSVEAVALPHPDYTINAGEYIPATLEVAMDSELPGMIRALTSHDVYALTGNRILIPKGSRLIGQYLTGNLVQTQSRFLISWTRVQLPNGIVVTLNSPSTDSLGRAGSEADSIDRHLFERFSSGILFSVLGATTATVGVNSTDEFNSASQYRIAVANSLQESARASLQRNQAIQPDLKKYQGAAIKVFVARDLSFFNVARRR
jgi:type IV secretion system protein VirB10